MQDPSNLKKDSNGNFVDSSGNAFTTPDGTPPSDDTKVKVVNPQNSNKNVNGQWDGSGVVEQQEQNP